MEDRHGYSQQEVYRAFGSGGTRITQEAGACGEGGGFLFARSAAVWLGISAPKGGYDLWRCLLDSTTANVTTEAGPDDFPDQIRNLL